MPHPSLPPTSRAAAAKIHPPRPPQPNPINAAALLLARDPALIRRLLELHRPDRDECRVAAGYRPASEPCRVRLLAELAARVVVTADARGSITATPDASPASQRRRAA